MKTSVETAASGSLEPKRAASTVPTHRNVEWLLTGPIGATLWRLAAPNTIGFLVGNGVAVAELWFVGQLGIHSLAGLALGFPMFMLMMMLSAGAEFGTMVPAVSGTNSSGPRSPTNATWPTSGRPPWAKPLNMSI